MKNNSKRKVSIEKNFDAVKMKNKIQAKLYEQTKKLNPKELIEFYRDKAKKGPFKRVG